MYQIKNLNKSYPLKGGGEAHVLKNINLNIEKAKITAIVGPSGSGKSTLSKCLSLLEQPTSGSLILDNVELNHLSAEALRLQRQKIGLVFQSSALLKRRTAAENIALPLEFLGVVEQQIKARVAYLLENVKLSDRANHYPAQLSGGQQQRVGIARALALQPQIVIADEATSGLDPDSTQSILKLLTELRDELGLSVILITHEMDVVRQIADEVAVLEQGEIVEQGNVLDLVLNPDSKIGEKILPIHHVQQSNNDHISLRLTYSTSKQTPLNWLGLLSINLGHAIEIQASTIEKIQGYTVGKVIIHLPEQLYKTKQNLIETQLNLWNIQFQNISHTPSNQQHHAA